ncbi:MAG: hypothetical protein ACRC2R_18785 [Xenococcaceae cyanobacterium]
MSILWGFVIVLAIPLRSSSIEANKIDNALHFAQQGQQNYDHGNFSEAAQLWERSADLYQRSDDGEGKTKSLINRSIFDQIIKRVDCDSEIRKILKYCDRRGSFVKR